MKRYNSILDMIKALGSNRFFTQFLLKNIQEQFKIKDKDMLHHASFNYQRYLRVYADEYRSNNGK